MECSWCVGGWWAASCMDIASSGANPQHILTFWTTQYLCPMTVPDVWVAARARTPSPPSWLCAFIPLDPGIPDAGLTPLGIHSQVDISRILAVSSELHSWPYKGTLRLSVVKFFTVNLQYISFSGRRPQHSFKESMLGTFDLGPARGCLSLLHS